MGQGGGPLGKVIEGLTVLPWFAEALNRNPYAMEQLSDCETCMEATTKRQRQFMGCGYEPCDPSIVAQPWDHEGRVTSGAPALTTCPGYTARLPVVTEISRLRLHWSKGALDAALDEGERLTGQARDGIELLERSSNEMEAWRMTARDKGGDRD